MLNKKLLSLLASSSVAIVALVGCESTPESDQNVMVGHAVAPGTAEDFKNNIRDRVFFDLNKSKISEESHKTLEAQAGWLKTYPSTKAVVEGKCDARGTREYNLALGHRRAEAAKSALAHMGVDAHRLSTISYGKDKLEVAGNSEEAHAQNRVAITVVE